MEGVHGGGQEVRFGAPLLAVDLPHRRRVGREVAKEQAQSAPGQAVGAEVGREVDAVVPQQVGLDGVLVGTQDRYEAEEFPASSL